MKTKYLIMAVKNSKKKVLNIFNIEAAARKMLSEYKNDEIESLYIKQVSVH